MIVLLALGSLNALEWSLNAYAWDEHRLVTSAIVESIPPGPIQDRLTASYPTTCEPEERQVYTEFAKELGLNLEGSIPPLSPEACATQGSLSLAQVLSGPSSDDPDQGMDKNLPESADPLDERKFMGGPTGPTSQGFRHMYFAGWKWTNPITTFQVPFKAVGQAPQRTQIIASRAKELIQKGNLLWGSRLLGWSLHYIEDLAQPFHSVQLPSLAIAPWSALWHWPPQEAFSNLVRETTRTVSNYHWAYEGYVLYQLEKARDSELISCLRADPEVLFKPIAPITSKNLPFELAHEVAMRSVEIAPKLGQALMGFFGADLKRKDYDLAHDKGTVDYERLAIDPEKISERDKLHAVTCEAFKTTKWASLSLINWAFE